MTNIRRYKCAGQTYFLTHVTFQRQPVLVSNFDLLRSALDKYLLDQSGRLIAWVVMPDHMHLLLDPADDDVSQIARRIKLSFSARLRRRLGRRSGRTWQYRFWDHIIRDQADMNRHIDYIHYNPVKHALVHSPFDWKYSSIHEDTYHDVYASDWGTGEVLSFEGEFGE